MLGEVEYTFDIGAVTVSKTHYRPHMYMPRHEHDLAYISIVLEGSYTKVCGTDPHKLNRAMLAFHPAGEAHADCVHGSNVSTLNFELREQVLPASFYAVQGPVEDRLCHDVLESLRGPGSSAARAIQVLVDHICAEARRAETASESLAQAMILLRPPQSRRVSAVAKQCGLHRSALHRAFRAAYGRSPREQRAHARVETAARLLAANDLLLAEIALESGFYDQSQFCRQFKQVIGMTPSAFRSRFFHQADATCVPGLESAHASSCEARQPPFE